MLDRLSHTVLNLFEAFCRSAKPGSAHNWDPLLLSLKCQLFFFSVVLLFDVPTQISIFRLYDAKSSSVCQRKKG